MSDSLVVMSTRDLASVIGLPSITDSDWKKISETVREIGRILREEGHGLCVVFSPSEVEDDRPKFSHVLVEAAERAEVRDEKTMLIKVLKSRHSTELKPQFILNYDFSRFKLQ